MEQASEAWPPITDAARNINRAYQIARYAADRVFNRGPLRLYELAYPKYNPNWPEAPYGKRRPQDVAIWMKIADHIHGNQFEPDLYVYCQFESTTAGGKIFRPKPSMLLSQQAVVNYNKASEKAIGLRQRLAVQTSWLTTTATARMTDGHTRDPLDATHYTLLSNDENLGALFRFCTAYNIAQTAKNPDQARNFRLVAHQYAKAAAAEYVPLRRLYDETWGHLIPPEFKDAASGLQLSYYTEEQNEA